MCRKLARIAAGASAGGCWGRRRRRLAVEVDGCDALLCDKVDGAIAAAVAAAALAVPEVELELELAACVEKEATAARLQHEAAAIMAAATLDAEDDGNAITSCRPPASGAYMREAVVSRARGDGGAPCKFGRSGRMRQRGDGHWDRDRDGYGGVGLLPTASASVSASASASALRTYTSTDTHSNHDVRAHAAFRW